MSCVMCVSRTVFRVSMVMVVRCVLCSVTVTLHNTRRTTIILIIKTNQFMVQVAQAAVYSQINTKHINTVWVERTVVEY